MNTRQDIIDASEAGTLLETIAAIPYDQFECVSRLLADLNNRGDIDFLASFEPAALADVSNGSIHFIHRIFCEALPHIDCPPEAAETACRLSSPLTKGWFSRFRDFP